MATPKKTHTTKKSTTKRAPVSATSKKGKTVKVRPLTWRFYVVTIGIFLIAVTTMIVLALMTASVVQSSTDKARLNRINDIYASLNLDRVEYSVTASNVFGDVRTYDYDTGRTQSSSISYVHGDTVSNTVADLDARIKAAGFTFVEEPYAGSKFIQYIYVSSDNEYLRLTVSSKPYDDVIINSEAMNRDLTEAEYAMDTNQGPSNVVIKVNLDDNNE